MADLRATVSRLGVVGGPAGWMRCLWGGCRRRLSSHSVLDAAVVGERGSMSISPVVFGEVLVIKLVEGGAVLVLSDVFNERGYLAIPCDWAPRVEGSQPVST